MTSCVNAIRSLSARLLPKLNLFINKSFSNKYLLYTNVTLSVSLSAVGDIIQQHYEILLHEVEKWDKVRTRNMAVSGLTIGVFCHHWYNFLDKRLPGYTLRIVAKKIIIDQFVCSPVCIGSLFVTCGVLERKTGSEMWAEMKQKALILYAAEWTIWPPAQFINFYFLPTRFRVLYDNTISLGFDVYASYVKHKDVETKDINNGDKLES